MELAPSIRAYYDRGGELDRLHAGHGLLEFLRTQDVIRRVLPVEISGPILDVGGGCGVHARWLADDGWRVRLIDPVPMHVEHASALPGVDAAMGDARALDEPDQAYAVTLLLGPLYHLTDRADRVRALRAGLVDPGSIPRAGHPPGGRHADRRGHGRERAWWNSDCGGPGPASSSCCTRCSTSGGLSSTRRSPAAWARPT